MPRKFQGALHKPSNSRRSTTIEMPTSSSFIRNRRQSPAIFHMSAQQAGHTVNDPARMVSAGYDAGSFAGWRSFH
jgi:hypothetical protein